MKTIQLDFNQFNTRREVHEFLKKKLDFPEYYGHNLDALHDLLSVYSEEIRIEVVPGKTEIGHGFLCVFKDVAEENNRVKIAILSDSETGDKMEEKTTLRIGFNRTDITPKNGGIPLAGYGATHLRLAAEIIDRLYANTIVIGHEKPEFVLITVDMINVREYYLEQFRDAITEALGVPRGQIFIGGTHTHSAPDYWSSLDSIATYFATLPEILTDSAKRAAADMLPTKIFYGRGEVGVPGCRFNFVKHYKMARRDTLERLGLKAEDLVRENSWEEKLPPEEIYDVGDNYGGEYSGDPEHYVYVGHEEMADPEMQVVRFDRENADSIVIINFQAHATVTGGRLFTKMSSDFPGPLREEFERMVPHTKCIFYQGAAGNLNTHTRIVSEGLTNITYGCYKIGRNHRAYAAVLAGVAYRINDLFMQESESDVVDFRKYIMTAPCDHTNDAKVEDAKKIREIYMAEGYTDRVTALCRELGFNSPYHANATISKSKLPETDTMEMNVLRFGDVGMITAPVEMFNTTGMFIKKNSPFKMTIIKAYSTGSDSYMPSINAYKNAYEWNLCNFMPGTAEKMADKYVEMLKEIF